jgi:carboxymethylenebutenolidase
MKTITTQMISYASNNTKTPAYLAKPADQQVHPALVIIQEWWGLVSHIKDVAERFAHRGYITLAPDLYHGRATSEPDEARKLAMELDRERAIHEIVSAITHLQNLPAVNPKQIGLVGWCMGGSLALATAAQASNLSAVVTFYGLPRDLSIIAQIQCPVLGLFGENDQGIPIESINKLVRELVSHHLPHQIKIYPGAGHAFFNDTRPHIYHLEAAQDSWRRTLEWFEKYIQS